MINLICAETTSNVVLSLIFVPVLTAALILVLYLLLSKRSKTDTLAKLLFSLQTLTKLCEEKAPDLKKIKKMDAICARCELACERATFEQKQDIDMSADKIYTARRIFRAVLQAKISGKDAEIYIEKAAQLIKAASDFLMKALNITADSGVISLDFFNTKAKSTRAKKYLESITGKRAETESEEDGAAPENENAAK